MEFPGHKFTISFQRDLEMLWVDILESDLTWSVEILAFFIILLMPLTLVDRKDKIVAATYCTMIAAVGFILMFPPHRTPQLDVPFREATSLFLVMVGFAAIRFFRQSDRENIKRLLKRGQNITGGEKNGKK